MYLRESRGGAETGPCAVHEPCSRELARAIKGTIPTRYRARAGRTVDERGHLPKYIQTTSLFYYSIHHITQTSAH